jgi:integrase-like protein
VHVNVTNHPTAAWTAHQLLESLPEETAPKYLLRDRDAMYGDVFIRRVKGLGISEILIAPRAPWQNPFAERVIGSIRRECLDHVIVINERHLRRLLRRSHVLQRHPPASVPPQRQPSSARSPNASGRGTLRRSRRSADFTTAISAPPETRGTQAAAMVRRCWTSCHLLPPVGLLDATIPSLPPRPAGSTYT